MINLLPQAQQQELLLAKNKKLIIVLGSVTIISLISLSLILFSLKFYILENIRFHQSIDVVVKNDQGVGISSFKAIIQKYNAVFSALDIFYKKEIYINDALRALLQVSKPPGLYFAGMSAERGADNVITVTVSGISDTRDNLLLFKQNLENSKGFQTDGGQQLIFKNIYFPPESWIKATNVDFYITFEIVKTVTP